ncbi:phospholipase A2 inhibitor and Ly6/PLAUR domain-containing protein-like [Erythrolamprus reginae]|uniref:phospholipase A2 inhibitor and Ly6/PLAUR domain-containing protein-like n=1 Tax=Erythrolamprus reginae TaxID=121349 RepID=UPI00396CF2AE
MGILLIYYLFDFLLAIGLGLQCERCSSKTSSCTGAPYNCPESKKACLILTIENVIENKQWFSTFKGCAATKNCPSLSMSFTFPSKHERRTSRCCYHDFCNKGAVKLEDTKKTRNGLKCPGCFSMNLDCQATEMLNCHDQERKCVYMGVTVQHGNQLYMYAKRGCGTKPACRSKERAFGIPGLYAEIWKNVTCSHAAKRLV